MNQLLTEYTPETEAFENETFETGASLAGEGAGALSEAEEVELASELLEVTSEEELEQVLGKLMQRAGGAAAQFVASPTGQALGGILKGAARQALPVVGGALGSYFGGEGGAKHGAKAAASIGRIFGLELEGLSGEDREFEIARSFVRFGGNAARNAVRARPSRSPALRARSAALLAARRHAPGFLVAGSGAPMVQLDSPETGQWVRRGRHILILDT